MNILKTLILFIILTGQILNCQTPLLEILIQDLKKLEDTICQPYTYFKVILFFNYRILLVNNHRLFYLIL